MCKSELILIGGGGHCKSCIDVIEQTGVYHIVGIVDQEEKVRLEVLGYEIITTDEYLPKLAQTYKLFFVTIGQIKNAARRIEIFYQLKALKVRIPTIISPYAYVSKHASIGEGSIIMHNALVNAGAKIGKNCIINTKALIEHDATVEDHCHIATNAVVNGGVNVASGVFWGSGTVSKEYINIGKNTIIGCNATVKKNLKASSIIV